MKKIVIILLSMLVAISLVACGGKKNTDTSSNTNSNTNTSSNTETDTNTNTDTGNTQTNTNSGTTNTNTDSNSNTNTGGGEVVIPPASDYESTTVEKELEEELKVFEKADEYDVGGTMDDYTTETVVNVADDASNGQYIISEAGTYRLTGESSDGQIYIKAPDQDVVLVLDNVSLANKTSVPPIYSEDCASVTIVLVGDNYLKDSSSNGETGVLRVRSCNLTIDGKGTLNIVANAKHGISNTKELTINGGTFNITAKSNGIYGKLGLTINAGRFNITTENNGLKSGDNGDNAVGYVDIKSGSFNMNVASNGINCNGPVTISDGRMMINAEGGNGIDATDNISITGGTTIIDSLKSAISTDANVTLGENANIKINTTGNGISAKDVTISTTGIVFIETTPRYEAVTAETPAEETIYVFVDGSYVKYDSTVHPIDAPKFIRKDCRGIEADGKVSINNGTVGIDSYQDAVNAGTIELVAGKLVINTTKDGFDAETVEIKSNAIITVLNSEKGISAITVTISGGLTSINAETDAIKAENTIVNAGKTYLFDKIDKGETGSVVVNGGTILMISTTSNMQTTTGAAKFISTVVENKNLALAGKWIEINCGSNTITLELPKDYTEKMAVYFTSNSMGADLIISIGTVDENNVFIAEKTEMFQ